MSHSLTHPEQIERLQRFAARQPEPASPEDVDASMPTEACEYCGLSKAEPMHLQREAGRSAEADSSSPVAADGAHVSMPALSRYANNLSDARILAEDAADLCRRLTHGDGAYGAPWNMEVIALAQAKALASIALNMAFGGGAS